MVARPAITLLLLTALLSGCVVEDDGAADAPGSPGDAGDAPSDIPSGSAPSGDEGGAPSSHGEVERSESAVTVTRQGSNSYQARKTVTLANDFGGASAADVTLTTHTGGVTASDWSDGGYEIVATLSASGNTEQEARSKLAQMAVTHTDSLKSGRLTLKTEVSGPGGGGLSAKLPPEPSYRLTMSTDTGGLATGGLGGSVLNMDTDTGGISASGAFNTATLSADTGGIDVDGTYNTLRVTTDTGGIDAEVKASASGSHTFEVGTGGIDVELTGGADHGYDVDASADTGSVDVDVDGASDVGTQSRTHKHVKSDGYDAKAIRLAVHVETGTGGVDVSG